MRNFNYKDKNLISVCLIPFFIPLNFKNILNKIYTTIYK